MIQGDPQQLKPAGFLPKFRRLNQQLDDEIGMLNLKGSDPDSVTNFDRNPQKESTDGTAIYHYYN